MRNSRCHFPQANTEARPLFHSDGHQHDKAAGNISKRLYQNPAGFMFSHHPLWMLRPHQLERLLRLLSNCSTVSDLCKLVTLLRCMSFTSFVCSIVTLPTASSRQLRGWGGVSYSLLLLNVWINGLAHYSNITQDFCLCFLKFLPKSWCT